MPTDDEILTTSGAAAVLGVSDETVRRWADQKLIRHILLPSGQLRFRRSDLDAVLVPVEPVESAEAAS